MSMSQEEIESLMNGLDFNDQDDNSTEETVEEEVPAGNMSEDDINSLIAETEDIVANSEAEDTEESVDELLNSLNEAEPQEEESDTNIDDILKELDEAEPQEEESEDSIDVSALAQEIEEETPAEEEQTVSNDNIDDLLASIDGITEDDEVPSEEPQAVEQNVQEELSSTPSVSVEEDNDILEIDEKINSGVFPLPAEQDTKVVNQLSQVASDSEEKASKIFDVLSNMLDYNSDIQNDVRAFSEFNEQQVAMLTSLTQKFPNIQAFKQNLEKAKEMSDYISNVNEKINVGNDEIFQAMELMQFHDINRQKIERVMSVIRKLSTYLNNLFEDDGNSAEVAVAKHIHGDNNEDLVGDEDLEALIAEFNN